MSDLHEILEPLTTDPVTAPLPAAEVRRRGDRRRRRRTALGSVGTVAAVAVIAAGALTAHDLTSTSPVLPAGHDRPTPSATRNVIPAGFDLAQGLPSADATTTVTRSLDLTEAFAFNPCGGVPPTSSQARDDFAAIRVKGDGGHVTRVRQLAVYRDEALAHDAFADFRKDLAGCPQENEGAPPWTYTEDPKALGGSDESMVVRTTVQGRVAEVTVMARVGTALLLTGEGIHGGMKPAVAAEVDATQRDEALLLAAGMCVFATSGCQSPTTALSPTGYGDLTLGMSADEVAASPEVASFDPTADGACVHGTLTDGGGFYWSRSGGLAIVFLGGAMHTEDGIDMRSSEVDVKAAYPQGHVAGGYWVVPLGHGAEYEFGLEGDGTIGEALLAAPHQDCTT